MAERAGESRRDAVLRYVREHPGCRAFEAAVNTCRRSDRADDLAGFAAVARLVDAGRLLRFGTVDIPIRSGDELQPVTCPGCGADAADVGAAGDWTLTCRTCGAAADLDEWMPAP